MTDLSQSSVRNRLLTALSRDDFVLLQPHLEPVRLDLHQVLIEPHKLIEHVHFVESGLGSLVAVSAGNEQVEAAHIGRDGMTGKAVIQGLDRSPNRTLVQVAGSALRMRSDALREALDTSPTLRDLLGRYMYVCTVQIAQTALAN